MHAARGRGGSARLVLVGAGALALVAGLLAWWLGGRSQPARSTPADSIEPAPSQPLDAAPAAEPEGSARSSPLAPESAVEAAPAAAAEVEEIVVAPAAVLLTGAAVRVEASGAEHASDDGRLVLHWLGSSGPERRDLAVVAGAFSVEVPPDVLLRVSDLELAGRPLAVVDRDLTLPAARFVEVRGLELFDVLLHVRSKESGEELDGVELRRAEGPAGEAAWVHPGIVPDGEPLVAGARSPLRVPPRADWYGSSIPYWVRATDHAWARVTLDHSAAGERTVELAGSGALEVELVGSAPWLAPLVRLWPPDASQWDAYAYAERRPDATDRALFESLAPGNYVASVERGWADRRTSFGKLAVEVSAGKTTRVRIPVELPEERQAVSVSGTLALGAGWKEHEVRLVLTAQGETSVWSETPIELAWNAMSPLSDAGATRAWRVELPTPGSFALDVEPRLLRALLEVPAGGLSDVALEVPPAARVDVRVIDDASGEEIAVEALYWSPLPIDGIVGTPLYTAAAGSESGRVSFVAPAGPVQVQPRDQALSVTLDEARHGETPTFDLVPGRNEIELRVRRQIGVRFTFLDGDAVVPWSWSWRLRAEKPDGSARDVARSIGILWFREEGVYELFSETMPGYASIDHTPIDVRAGAGMIEIDVPLRRE